jgi:hypothetical protein
MITSGLGKAIGLTYTFRRPATLILDPLQIPGRVFPFFYFPFRRHLGRIAG